MGVYSIEVTYPGPTSHLPGFKEADGALFSANTKLVEAATKLGIPMTHQYTWPDGSLFKFVRIEEDHVQDVLSSLMVETGFHIAAEAVTMIEGQPAEEAFSHRRWENV